MRVVGGARIAREGPGTKARGGVPGGSGPEGRERRAEATVRYPGIGGNRRRLGGRRSRWGALGAIFALSLAQAAPLFGAPPEPPPIVITADHLEYQTETQVLVGRGHVRARRGEDTISADELVADLATQEVEARGHVTLSRAGQVATGSLLRYNFRTRSGRMEQVETRYGPWTLLGQSLETAPGGRGIARGVSITPCDPRRPAFRVAAREVVVVPGDRLTAYDASLYVYSVHVLTLPVYTARLKPGGEAQSAPVVGYNRLDGVFTEYRQLIPLGSLEDRVRIRYGTLTQFTAENVLGQTTDEYAWAVHLGRQQLYDQNGNLVNLDHTSLTVSLPRHELGALPVAYQVEAHTGQYSEPATGVTTSRTGGLAAFATPTVALSPTLSGAASASVQYDAYGTGQQRTVVGVQAALTQLVGGTGAVTLSYNSTGITGATPFSFDSQTPAATATLSYSALGAGVLQSWGASVSYDFLGQQTTLGGNAALALSPTTALSVAATYNVSTSQVTEVDYALTARCDCLAVGLLYRTFPPNPSQNQLFLTIGLAPLPGAVTSIQL